MPSAKVDILAKVPNKCRNYATLIQFTSIFLVIVPLPSSYHTLSAVGGYFSYLKLMQDSALLANRCKLKWNVHESKYFYKGAKLTKSFTKARKNACNYRSTY